METGQAARNGWSSSSSSVRATAINKLIILLVFEREVGTVEKTPYVAGLEALDTKVSMIVASTVFWGTVFQSWIVCGKNNCCWYCVLCAASWLHILVGVASSLSNILLQGNSVVFTPSGKC